MTYTQDKKKKQGKRKRETIKTGGKKLVIYERNEI